MSEGPRPEDGLRVAVLGAGVIGRVLAARLHTGGVDTVLLTRDRTRRRLEGTGLRLHHVAGSRRAGRDREPDVVSVPLADAGDPGRRDVVLVAVRATSLTEALDTVEATGARIVVPTMHLAGQRSMLLDRLGTRRVVPAFPGFGGHLEGRGTDAETVVWADLGSRQPTTVDGRGTDAETVAALLRRTGLRVAVTDDMPDWMAAHAVFVGGLGAGLALAGGDPAALAGDRRLLRRTTDAIRDGFDALHARGVRVEPAAVDLLHRRLPAWFAPLYWARVLPGPVGRVTIAPHAAASRWDEMPMIWREALAVTGGGDAGALRALLAPLLRQSSDES